MQWKTFSIQSLTRNWLSLLAFATVAIAAARPGQSQNPSRTQSRSANSSANSPGSSAANAPRSVPLPRAAADTSTSNNSSSRRALGYPGTPTPAPPADKNATAKTDASKTDGAFAEGDTSTADQSPSTEEPAIIFATIFDDPPAKPAAKLESASFKGVRPGETSAEQLEETWGKGREISHDDDQTVLSFSLPKFPNVEVTLVEDKVRTIVINLDQSVPTDTLAKQLQLGDVRPVNVPDDSGELLGQAYPERGVLFSITPDGKRVSHVVLDRIDLSTFVLRAEDELHAHTRTSLADLDFVLSRQPKNARPLWLRGRLLTMLARYDEALDAVDMALSVQPNEPLYHLTRGEILGKQSKYDEAIQETKGVLADYDAQPETKAKALCQLGDLLATSPAHDYKVAMEHHLSAIKLADPVSVDKRLAVRRAAKMVLIDAHLGVANDVACGNWQQKERVVPKWLDRAKAYVDDTIAHEDGEPSLRLHLANGALVACAGAEGKIDSVPWARMALQLGKPLVMAASDPWTRLNLQWELGVALSDGLAADELRGPTNHALPNTALTITYLETGAKGRREMPEDAFRLGWLYYRMGSLHAVQRNDHKTAIAWYEKAFPLLDRPLPPTLRNQQGHYGEWLVSMGISYWEEGSRDFALQLTDAGLQHVQEAVNRKLIDEKALGIPYSNLAYMHESLGHKNEAQNFSQLASKYESSQAVKR